MIRIPQLLIVYSSPLLIGISVKPPRLFIMAFFPLTLPDTNSKDDRLRLRGGRSLLVERASCFGSTVKFEDTIAEAGSIVSVVVLN